MKLSNDSLDKILIEFKNKNKLKDLLGGLF